MLYDSFSIMKHNLGIHVSYEGKQGMSLYISHMMCPWTMLCNNCCTANLNKSELVLLKQPDWFVPTEAAQGVACKYH
jgi:hypothetical protein